MLALACLVQLRCGAQFMDEGGAMFDDEEEPPDRAPNVHLARSQIKSGGPIRVPPKPKVERSLPYDHPANFVYKQYHPLNTGIPGKLYNDSLVSDAFHKLTNEYNPYHFLQPM